MWISFGKLYILSLHHQHCDIHQLCPRMGDGLNIQRHGHFGRTAMEHSATNKWWLATPRNKPQIKEMKVS
jgi:myo-inositol catabolism protein IolC